MGSIIPPQITSRQRLDKGLEIVRDVRARASSRFCPYLGIQLRGLRRPRLIVLAILACATTLGSRMYCLTCIHEVFGYLSKDQAKRVWLFLSQATSRGRELRGIGLSPAAERREGAVFG